MPSIERLDILRELRMQAGFSQEKMAEYCGLKGRKSLQTAGSWERGEIVPSRTRRAKFMGYLWDRLGLKRDPGQFEAVWEILCKEWKWEPISEQEWKQLTHQPRPARQDELAQKVTQLEDTLRNLQDNSPHGVTNGVTTGVAETPAMLPLPPLPRPPEPSAFIGRAEELATYRHLLATEGLALITGMAGVGKSTLAAVLASQSAPDSAIFWHSFHEGEGIELLIWRLAAFLAMHDRPNVWQIVSTLQQSGGQMPPPPILFDYLFEQWKGQNFLLCLDDFQFVEDDPSVHHFTAWLAAHLHPQQLRVIMTARQCPRFAQGKPRWRVAPLGGLSAIDTYHFIVHHGLALSDRLQNDLYTYTGGNVQFLTLAVAALQQTHEASHFMAQMAEASDVERYLLTQIDRQLSEEERSVMEAVALSMGYPASRDALEAILNRPGIQRTLMSLCQRHLLLTQLDAPSVPQAEARPRTYDQHGLVRTFYYNLLGRRDRRVMHQRAGVYYHPDGEGEADLLLSARHLLRAEEYVQAATLLTRDIWAILNRGQAQAAYHLLLETPAASLNHELAIDLDLALGQVALLLGEQQQAKASYQQAIVRLAHNIAASGPTDLSWQYEARACCGMAELLQDEAPSEALVWLERGLQAVPTPVNMEEQRGTEIEVALYTRLGYVRLNLSDYPGALQAFQQALAQLPAGSCQLRTRILNNLGTLYTDQAHDPAQVAQGMAYYREALAISEAINDRWMMVALWHNLGIELEIAGEWADAVATYGKAQEWAEELGSRRHQVEVALSLGILLTKQGDYEAAFAQLAHAIALARQHMLNEHLLHALSSLADLHMRTDDVAAAEPCLLEAQRLAKTLAAQDVSAEIHRLWALIYLQRGEMSQALVAAEHAVTVARALATPLEEGISLRVLGKVCQAQGHTKDALAAFAQSHDLLAARDPYEAARTQVEWGQWLLSIAPNQGGEYLQQATLIFQRLGAQS